MQEKSAQKELDGHKICEALSQPLRANILCKLIKNYPNKLTISALQKKTSQPRMTVWFHINKLREANLVKLNGSRRGFRATTKALTLRFNGDGIHLEEAE
jgi:DNA-binding transcriptional ArsR family regulator